MDGISWTWHEAGQLKANRKGHSIISVGNKFLVVGGRCQSRCGSGDDRDNLNTEACFINDDRLVVCNSLESKLKLYVYYPILFLVSDDYGNC